MVDRFYPSSQICSNCKHVQKMPLKERVYNCPECGLAIDRDLNASINLEQRKVKAVRRIEYSIRRHAA